jgi:hypothetical protein
MPSWMDGFGLFFTVCSADLLHHKRGLLIG